MSLVPIRPEEERAWVELMAPAIELAKAVANTDFVPKGLRGNPAAITAAILYGDEVGLGPMQALAKIAVIDGRPTLSAEAQRALILAAGHDLWIEEATGSRATIGGRRKDSDRTSSVTWTLDDARKANLAGRPAWRTYPRQMLLARASAELARTVFADAIGGLSATEELEEPGEGQMAALPGSAEAEAEGTTVKRKRKRAPAATVTAPASASLPSEPELPPLPDEPPEPQPPALMSDAQRRKMQALFRERGINDREARLRYTRRAIERPELESSLELTMEEASTLIDRLEEPPHDPAQTPLPEDY